MTTLRTLEQALKDILAEDHKISKYDAQALKALILSDGRVSNEEKAFLESALRDNSFDQRAYEILSQLLLKEEMKFRE